ncbi:DsbA family protein [Alphaproteobacteria bacterium]|nr:DsbA family protein [Alphaproteobacteria bacterium]
MNEIPLEVFTDYVCPWCYLGDVRVKKIKKNFNIKIKLVHFPLHPETPKEGRTLLELFRTSPEDIKEKNSRMKGLMEQENLPYNDRTHTYNSRLAQEVGAWAETIQPDTTIHDKFYEAYFVNGLNVGLEEVILDVVSKSNLDVNEAKSVILNRTFKSHIDKDWEKSEKYGVTGVPTFVYEGQSLVGAQPYESLERFLNHFGIKSN